MHSTDQMNIKHALNEKGGMQVWWRLLRPHTLTASFVPVFVGTMLANIDGTINIPLFLAMLIASMLIQAATNMFNEYYDFVRGLDNEESVGIGGTIVRDGIAAKTVLRLALSFFAVAMLLGVYICAVSSWWIAVIGLACMLFGYLYTGGPLPIAYTPLGELFSGFLMGTVIICISYFIQTLTITASTILVSIPVAIFIGCIMMSNNIRDLDGDKENGRKTIAILLGRKNAIRFLGALFVIAFGLTAYYIIDGLLPIWSLIVFLSGIKAVDVYRKFQGKTKPIEMLPAMVATGKTNTIYGFLLGISLLLSEVF
ncbi:1,4-dihydroxy-2-naphthoate polyprenyltransferase [Lentibacillus sp. N15]|uniref:1,4-dihydroxy-2-naphthoate polyprenyltransferase n=1 Tax=Lentibacillus songyuanensis TaxID=3136161 RepID=UPI0031BA887F